MKIECPNCKLTGQASDLNIPAEGRYMNCPRCKTSFLVKKTATANWVDTMTDCPECGYTSFNAERFDICPNCGLVAAAYREKGKRQPSLDAKDEMPAEGPATMDREGMRQELERLEREEQKKRQQRAGGPAAEPLPEEPAPVAPVVPDPIKYLGWGFVLAGILVLVYGLKGGYDYLALNPADTVAQDEVPPGTFMLFLTYGLASLLQTALGLFVIAAGTCFAKMKTGARKLLEAAAWCGVAYVAGSEAASLVSWFRRSSGASSITYYLVGFADSVLMAALWSAPLLAAIWYVRSDAITDIFEQ
ncbi:MAG TPA: zinc-ribbon domain-containing protein [Geobacteraceae bacterium]|nr:zinc-ribbon domain-containing protein [Geobacteraceae bacterium]